MYFLRINSEVFDVTYGGSRYKKNTLGWNTKSFAAPVQWITRLRMTPTTISRLKKQNFLSPSIHRQILIKTAFHMESYKISEGVFWKIKCWLKVPKISIQKIALKFWKIEKEKGQRARKSAENTQQEPSKSTRQVITNDCFDVLTNDSFFWQCSAFVLRFLTQKFGILSFGWCKMQAMRRTTRIN